MIIGGRTYLNLQMEKHACQYSNQIAIRTQIFTSSILKPLCFYIRSSRTSYLTRIDNPLLLDYSLDSFFDRNT